MSKDYGKPIGYTCQHFINGAKPGDTLSLAEMKGPPCKACIPVYAEIPEGQRPEADEPDEDDVLLCVPESPFLRYLWVIKEGERARPRFAIRNAREAWDVQNAPSGTNGDLAAAVLWAAEGRLP